LRRLPEFFGHQRSAADYGAYDIEILAEINHAPRMTLRDILAEAANLQEAGADLIDVGCDPGEPWSQVGAAVAALVAEGHRVSIDSMNVREIDQAVRSGAQLVLSVNSSNREAAVDWGCGVVVVPDDPAELNSLDESVEFLASRSVRLRIDPILEPIGFGFAASLGRYLETRRRYPDAEMLMGIGNLTELTDADSAPINVLLLGFCQELGIHSVLTTQVINWARTSVRECDLARRLVYHAYRHRTLPKRVEPRLVMLRDAEVLGYGDAALKQLAVQLKDHNYRLFAESGKVHAITAGQHLSDSDPFLLFEKLQATAEKPVDASHAFYLGYEMAKAATALTLGKEYRQDEALDWGLLTQAEQYHRLARRSHDRAAEPSAQTAPSSGQDASGANSTGSAT
jgi:dihydropteroate synthase